MLQFINRLLGRHQNTLPPFDLARNRFPAKKKWPPHLRELTEKQQFRFERKFKRRIKAKSIRPVWNKWTKIVQWSMISMILVYGVFFHDYRDDPMNTQPGQQVFENLRKKTWALFGGFYTHTGKPRMAGEREDQTKVLISGRQVEGQAGGQSLSPRA